MLRKKIFVDPATLGKPVEDSIREKMADPEYRKHYMLYQVRASIAAAIKSLRNARGLTQKELAERAGVPQPQIARLESLDDERIPSLEQLVKVLSALDSRAVLKILPSGPSAEKQEVVLVS